MPIIPVLPPSHRLWLLAVAAAMTFAASGCTTVLSTASLRDLVLGIDDRIDDSTIPSSTELESSDGDADGADAERRAAAIEEAISRLSKVGALDDDARDTLVATLQRTNQEDWPVVVEAFAESLADAPAPHVVAKADLDTGSTTVDEAPAIAHKQAKVAEPEGLSSPRDETTSEVAIETAPPITPVVAVSVAPDPEPIPEPEPTPPAAMKLEPAAPSTPTPGPSPALTIRNAAFASRVQAWGVLDRFEASRFRPGQDVIVYFELENLSAGESAAGHTTCIDSRLRCVTGTGDVVHEWTFEPIAETCRARRHDYFARYVIRIPPEAKPGLHRIELTVTDTLSGQEAIESIDLEIVASNRTVE